MNCDPFKQPRGRHSPDAAGATEDQTSDGTVLTNCRKTKIVCTIGPVSADPEVLQQLAVAGMDVVRLNFSHGDQDSHLRVIQAVRRISRDLGREIGILQDLAGPKIRIGNLPVAERTLRAGEEVFLTAAVASTDATIPVNYPHLLEDVFEGEQILMADGLIDLRVEEKLGERLRCRVVSGGTIQSHKGVNLPASNLRISAVTNKDLADLAFGLEQGVDFVALSFVRHEDDLVPVRAMLDRSRPRPLLIAKIEKSQAVARLEQIMAEVDGLMVARGDLGVEMPLEEVPITQKKIIRTARQAGKPVITATQMLLSMVTNPRPTRAEVTDVANAILDGTDALMLSDETTLGAHPVEAVAVLDRIARSTEPYMDEQAFLNEAVTDFLPVTATAISRAACWLAQDLRAAAIVASTSSGSTARLVARFRPSCPVVALTPELATQRQLSLSWGVIADLVQSFGTTDQMFALARSWALAKGIAATTDRLVITAGIPVGVSGTTNLVKVLELARSLEPPDEEADK